MGWLGEFGWQGSAGLGGLLWLAIVAWALVDCIRMQNGIYWILAILFFQPFGPIAYFVIHLLPTLETGRRWDSLWAGQRRIAQLKAQIHNMDLPHHWAKLGDEYRNARKWADAIHCYEEALIREPGNEEARYGLGLSQLAMGAFQQAADRLWAIAEKNPRYDYGQAMMAVARAWRGLGQRERALWAYERVLENYTYSETQFEYAELLHEMGRKAEAIAIMKRIVADAKVASGFARARERRWGRRARLFLRLQGEV